MLDINNGVIEISDELTIFPDYSFEQFKNTRFYNNQDGVRIFYLDEQQIIDSRKYIVSLFFRNGKIYMVSLICCDKEFSEKNEDKRKLLHDNILNELGIKHHEIRPRAPAHNGKVKRSHRNDNERFYSYLKFYSLDDLRKQCKAYLKRSNNIPMAVLNYKTPLEKELSLRFSW